MLKYLYVLIMIAGVGSIGSAQEAPPLGWNKTARGGLNVTQTNFDNWSGGGENSFSWQLNVNGKFVQKKEHTTWKTTGKLVYGAISQGDAETRKSVDEIKVESVLTYELGSKINPFAAVTGETQFAAGYDYSTSPSVQTSAFMDPGYFRESLGAGYDIREGLSTRLGLSFKQTVTKTFAMAIVDDPETVAIEKIKSEFGFESVSDLSVALSETSIFTSKLELFSGLKSFNDTDVNWDNTVDVKVTELININLNLKLVYDTDISAKRQLKQTMALGFNYTFI